MILSLGEKEREGWGGEVSLRSCYLSFMRCYPDCLSHDMDRSSVHGMICTQVHIYVPVAI